MTREEQADEMEAEAANHPAGRCPGCQRGGRAEHVTFLRRYAARIRPRAELDGRLR